MIDNHYYDMKCIKTVQTITLLLFSAFSDCFAQSAEDGDMLYVYTKFSDEAAKYQLDDVNKITFGSKGVQLWSTNWPTEYPYTKVSVLSFKARSNDMSAVRSLNDEEGRISIGYNASNGIVTVVGDMVLESVAIYGMQGQAISVDKSKKMVYNLSLRNAPLGVYVVKAFGKKKGMTKKIVRH